MREITPEEFNAMLRSFRNDNWKFESILKACDNSFDRMRDHHRKIVLEAMGVQLIQANDIYPFTKIIDEELKCGECGRQGWRYKRAGFERDVVLCKEHHDDITAETVKQEPKLLYTGFKDGNHTFTVNKNR